MAAGDIIVYDKWMQGCFSPSASGLSSLPVDLDTDTIKVAVMVDTFVPDTDETTTQAHWSNVSADQVATGTAYTGPITLANTSVSVAGGTVTIDGDDITIAQDATGFTNGRYLVFFKDTGTPATSPLIAIGDLGANKSIQAGSQTFQWAGTGILTASATP